MYFGHKKHTFRKHHKDTKKPAILLFMRICGLLKLGAGLGFEPKKHTANATIK